MFTNVSEIVEYIINKVIWNSKLDLKFQSWADLDPSFKRDLIFMMFGIHSRQNTLMLNTLFGIDDLVPNFGPTMKLLSKFKKFCTKNTQNIRIDIHCLDSGEFHFKINVSCYS